MPGVLAVDVGTSAIKAVVWDAASGRPIAARSVENDADVAGLPRECHEQDPLRILALCRETMRGAVTDPAVDAAAIAAIAISGQMHGVLLVDRHLAPVTHLITWRDRRTAEGELPTGGAKRTGCGIHPGYGGATLGWLAGRGRLSDGVTALSMAGFVAAALTGTAAMEPTHAASWGIMNLRAGTWDSERIAALGLPIGVLPAIRPSSSPLAALLPRYAGELGLSAGIPVCSPIGDAQAAVLAAAGSADDAAVLNLGTGGQISVMSREFAIAEGLETRPMPHGGYVLVGASLCGGWSYAYLERFFRAVAREFTGHDPDDAEVYRRMNALAAEAGPGAGGLTVDPRFSGARGRADLQGAIQGINTANLTPGNLARGFLEGIVGELFDMAARIGPGSFSRVLLAGQLARRNPTVPEIVRSQFGVPCTLGPADEDSACGAAFAVAQALALASADRPAEHRP